MFDSERASPPLPSSLTPVSEEGFSESDVPLGQDSASVAEAETEVAPPLERCGRSFAGCKEASSCSAYSAKEGFYVEAFCLQNCSSSGCDPVAGQTSIDQSSVLGIGSLSSSCGYPLAAIGGISMEAGEMVPSVGAGGSNVRVSSSIGDQQQPLTYETGGPQKRARPERANIAPRAARRRRVVSRPGVLRSVLGALRPEALISILMTVCERQPAAAEAVRGLLAEEPAARRLAVRNVPFGLSAGELRDALENSFGPVEALAVSRGTAAVCFASVETTLAAAFGNGLSIRGRVLQFRFLAPSDSVWDLLTGGAGVDIVGETAAPVVVARRPSRRRRELLVRELAPSTTEAALAAAFAHFGDLRRVYVPTDSRGRSKGHGFVTFQRSQDALRAAQQTQRLIGDQLAYVTLAHADRPKHRRVRHSTGGGGGTKGQPRQVVKEALKEELMEEQQIPTTTTPPI
eukprot:Protomagalhaensia_sp_Gyna_25__1816@NODE_195_length_4515_cov_24_568141_g150_i0_p2_GENE_NODE_195_length_4515_cov_24_568141_g150_i0NODE_195_length_4515_cov_24_568141_g150_i0_p2_ORF_typecomplete_len459_score94_29RRM_1/PF00076_22/0_019RRM_1/PF00076_22/1_6e13Nup35_RRM_2/PF14605_6/2_9e02Nup35_RRM_2/PF14605_6/0_0015DUF1866/PF08952_11/14DUF1866/PF08952_11/0_87TMPTENI/PF02581_17/0_059TMPTENI/PF02581_17/4_1e03RRM_7/PF16367_5/0_051RRM_occluded/PF16842_5/27RRM_occluded/PF16842_5/4_1Cut8/PF08559_10/0_079DUF42